MTGYEYCVVTLGFESQEMEINEEQRARYLAHILSKNWSPEAMDGVKRLLWKEVLVAYKPDASGKEQEILRIYTGEHSQTTVVYQSDKNDRIQILLTSHGTDGVWSNDYPVKALTRAFDKLGLDGWEVVEYKFTTGRGEFAQALLKRIISQTH